jgi:hypothetical protein
MDRPVKDDQGNWRDVAALPEHHKRLHRRVMRAERERREQVERERQTLLSKVKPRRRRKHND